MEWDTCCGCALGWILEFMEGGGRGRSGRVGCTPRPAALGCGVLAWGRFLEASIQPPLTQQHQGQGRLPGTWCPHVSLEGSLITSTQSSGHVLIQQRPLTCTLRLVLF